MLGPRWKTRRRRSSSRSTRTPLPLVSPIPNPPPTPLRTPPATRRFFSLQGSRCTHWTLHLSIYLSIYIYIYPRPLTPPNPNPPPTPPRTRPDPGRIGISSGLKIHTMDTCSSNTPEFHSTFIQARRAHRLSPHCLELVWVQDLHN